MALEAKNSSASIIRSWRTSFLSLRNEIQALPSLQPSRPAIDLQLLNHHIFSKFDNLIAAAQKTMPPPEVTADIILLMELACDIPDSGISDELIQLFLQLSHFCYLWWGYIKGQSCCWRIKNYCVSFTE